MSVYDERLSTILEKQNLDETRCRFGNLKDGDKLRLRNVELLFKEPCLCSFVMGMEKHIDSFVDFKFDISYWGDNGIISIYGYGWSLDMFEYDRPKYEVELI